MKYTNTSFPNLIRRDLAGARKIEEFGEATNRVQGNSIFIK